VVKKLFGLVGHAIAIGVVVWAWWQVASWYFDHLPLLGIDFYNTVTYVKYLSTNWVPFIDGWKNIWWSGHPLSGEYPTLIMYFAVPAAKMFGEVAGVQVTMMLSALVFWVFAYLAIAKWSGSRVIGMSTVGLGVISIGAYGALVWGGSLPYYATQMFMPIVLYLAVKGVVDKSVKSFLMAGVVTGVSVWGHPQSAIVYIVPIVWIMSLFFKRWKEGLGYTTIAIVVAYPEMLPRIAVPIYLLPFWLVSQATKFVASRFVQSAGSEGIGGQLSSSGAETAKHIVELTRNNFWLFLKETNTSLLYFAAVMFGLGLVMLMIKPVRKSGGVRYFLVSLSVFAYQLGYIGMYALGFSFYHGGWYRVFWSLPILLGLLIGSTWRMVWQATNGRFWMGVKLGMLGMVMVVTGVGWWFDEPGFFTNLDTTRLAYTEASSAWPMALNYQFSTVQLERIKSQLVPKWLDTGDVQHRFYSADAQVNIWWNALYKMPEFRGYIDPPIGNDRRGGYFWWDVTVNSDQLVKVFNWSEQTAVNNAKFLVDWFAIRYIEAGHNSSSYAPLSTYLNNKFFVKNEEDIKFVDRQELFKAYLRKEQIPIKVSKRPVILFVGNEDAYYAVSEVLNLAKNPIDAVIIKGPDLVDSLIGKDLQKYDGIMLYNYGYSDFANKQRIWSELGRFVAGGKNVYLETGGGTPDSETFPALPKGSLRNLPQEFPIGSTSRVMLGGDWNINLHDRLLKNVEVDKFDELKNEIGQKWTLSVPVGANFVDNEAKVLAEVQDYPVVLQKKIGNGSLVWSGTNLVMHARMFKNRAEAELAGNIFASLFGPGRAVSEEAVKFVIQEPGKIVIKAENGRGLMFVGETNKQLWNVVGGDGRSEDLQVVNYPEKMLFVDFGRQSQLEERLVEYKGGQNLHYYEVMPELTNEIIAGNNASVVGFVGNASNYETFFRGMAMENLNSKIVVPIKIAERIKDVSQADLANIDALVVYGYVAKDREEWQIIEKWIEGGGKMFVDTGSDAMDTANVNLPDFFPGGSSVKKQLGSLPAFVSSSNWADSIDASLFGEVMLDGKPWDFSVMDGGFKPDSQVLVSQADVPVIIKRKVGAGMVVWSGMNLPYHAMVFKATEEGRAVRMVLSELVGLNESNGVKVDWERINPQKINIFAHRGTKGVLVREQLYDWKAWVNGKRTKVYAAGPTYHGFIWVPLANLGADVDFDIKLRFGGGNYLGYLHYAIACLTIVLVIDFAVFGTRGLARWLVPLWSRWSGKARGWWDTDNNNN
jgi:type 1 glutamine amidotransferase